MSSKGKDEMKEEIKEEVKAEVKAEIKHEMLWWLIALARRMMGLINKLSFLIQHQLIKFCGACVFLWRDD